MINMKKSENYENKLVTKIFIIWLIISIFTGLILDLNKFVK